MAVVIRVYIVMSRILYKGGKKRQNRHHHHHRQTKPSPLHVIVLVVSLSQRSIGKRVFMRDCLE